MDNELTVLGKRNTKFNFYIRITEAVLCALCLIAFLVIFFLISLLIFVTIIILIVAALSLLLVFLSLGILLKLRKEKRENFDKRWIYVALILTILYILALALLILQLTFLPSLPLILTAVLAALTAIVFLVDFLYNFCFALLPKRTHTRRNQVQPENTEPNKEACGMIECSVIVGDQLACNQQLCHVKWSSDQASSPTAKLIYVQPCNSSIVNKVCPACKSFNCEKCFKTDNNAEEKKSDEKISQTDFKSTQFPENNEKICPLCSFKAVKVFKTAYVQTSDFSIPTGSCCKQMPEEKSTRDDLSHRPRFSASPKLSQSSPITPRKSSYLMICPNCRRRSSWFPTKNTHLCPLCNQQCSNKVTCSACYYTIAPPAVPPEPSKRKRSSNIPRIKRTSKAVWKSRFRKDSKKQLTEDESESSPEQYYTVNEKIQVERRRSKIENKVVQVSSKDFFVDAETQKKYDCCTKTDCRGRPEDNETRNMSSKELLDEMRAIMLMDRSTEQIYKNRAFNNRYSVNQSMLGESTQVSSDDFLELQTPRKEDKLTQVSVCNFSEGISKQEDKQTQVSITSGPEKEMDSSFDDKKYDNVQKERRPCGAPNCQHPRCGKAYQTEDEATPLTETFNESIQTESPKVDEETMTVGNTCAQTCKSIEVIKEISCQTGTSLEEIKEMSCQTGKSLEEIKEMPNRCCKDRTYEEIIPVSKEEREVEKEEHAGCSDPTCHCIVTEKEILVCMYCQSLLNKSKEINSGFSGDEETQTPGQSGCMCNLPTCICCKVPRETDEETCSGNETMKEKEISPKCFCVKTPAGLLKCTLCESIKKAEAEAEATDKDALNLPTCSSSVSACLYYRPRIPEPDDPNKKRRVTLQSREQSTSTSTSTKSSFQKTNDKSPRRSYSVEEQKHK